MTSGGIQGGSLVLDAANGGVTYAPFHEADVPAEVAEAIEALRLELAAEATPPG